MAVADSSCRVITELRKALDPKGDDREHEYHSTYPASRSDRACGGIVGRRVRCLAVHVRLEQQQRAVLEQLGHVEQRWQRLGVGSAVLLRFGGTERGLERLRRRRCARFKCAGRNLYWRRLRCFRIHRGDVGR